MSDIKMKEAFSTYNAKPVRRARSAMTADGDLVMSCWYGGFKKAEVDTMRYEEDLSGQTGEVAKAFRAHLTDALTKECAVRVIVVTAGDSKPATTKAPRVNYYAREDLVGRVSSFDGERLVVDFRKRSVPAIGKAAKGRSSAGRAEAGAR